MASVFPFVQKPAKILKNKKNKPDPDFEQRKRTEMYHALYAKFSQHIDLVKTLYLTQDAKLVRRINKQKKEDFLELMWLREVLRNYGYYLTENAKLQEGFVAPTDMDVVAGILFKHVCVVSRQNRAKIGPTYGFE